LATNIAGLAVIRKNWLEQRQLFLAEVHGAHRFAFIERGLAFLEDGDQLDATPCRPNGRLGHAVQGFFDRGQVGQAKFGLDDFDVGDRVHLAGDVDHVVVFEAAHHVDRGIGFADVGQELVAQAFARAGARHQAGDVHKLDDGRNNAFGLDDFANCANLGSGTSTMPTLGSMVQKG
jgi:hypothetical protein